MNILVYVISIVFFLSTMYFCLRLGLSALAQKNILVTTIKNGRIKFVTGVKNGGVVKFLANLENLGFHIDERTGVILKSEEKWPEGNQGSLFWRIFKVRWIGLCHVYTYGFPKMYVDGTTDESAKLPAESIFFRSAYIISMKNVESRGTIPFNIEIRVIIEIVDASKTISIGENWPSYFVNPAKASVINIVGKSEPLDLINKTGIDSAKKHIIREIMKNKSPKEKAGLEIVSVDITNIDPSDPKTKQILESKETERIQGDAREVKARKDLTVAEVKKQEAIVKAEGEAEAILKKGKAEAEIIKEKVASLDGKAENLVGLETAAAIATAQPKVLSIGKGGVGTIVQIPE